MGPILGVVLLVALGLGTQGCGSSGTTASGPRPAEVAQPLPKLPPGWEAHRDRSIGFAIGIPPRWELESGGGRVLVRSPDHLVAVTVSVDRNAEALDLPPGEFATGALAALPGFANPLRPTEPRRFGGTPLDAVQVTAEGTASDGGIRERATLVVLRHDASVNYAVAIVENAERQSSRLDRAVALRMVRTLRDQPVEVRSSPESG